MQGVRIDENIAAVDDRLAIWVRDQEFMGCEPVIVTTSLIATAVAESVKLHSDLSRSEIRLIVLQSVDTTLADCFSREPH